MGEAKPLVRRGELDAVAEREVVHLLQVNADLVNSLLDLKIDYSETDASWDGWHTSTLTGHQQTELEDGTSVFRTAKFRCAFSAPR